MSWEGFFDGLLNIMLFIPRHLFSWFVDLVHWVIDLTMITDDAGNKVHAIPYLTGEVTEILNQVPMLPYVWGYFDIGLGLFLIGGIAVTMLFVRRLPGF